MSQSKRNVGWLSDSACAQKGITQQNQNVTIQREAQYPSPAGEGRERGIRKGIFAYLILLSPALSIRRESKLSPFSDSLNSYIKTITSVKIC